MALFHSQTRRHMLSGDNTRALASGLSYVQADKHDIIILYHHISVDLAHHEILRS